MEEHTQPAEEQTSTNASALVIGAVVVVAVVGIALYVMRSKPTPGQMTQETTTPIALEPTPTPGPITKFACESQYYNPVVGFPRYYLSAEGVDAKTTTKVTCKFTVSVDDKVVATEKAETPVIQAPERGGVTFRCSTKGLELEKSVPTKVDVTMENGSGQTAACTKIFALP